MEAKDVWLLLASIPISYLAGLLTTYTAPSIGTAVGKLKSGFIERNKATALASYAVVRDLKSGKRDKHLYAIMSWGYILLYLQFFTIGAILAIFAKESTASADMSLATGAATLSLLLAARRFLALTIALERVGDFDHYRAKLLQR